MLVGHVAVGLTLKLLQPRLSLGTLVLAAMLADLLWCFFMIVGLEHVQFKSALGAANYFVATNIAISHSLLMDGLWAILFAAIYFARRRDVRGAWIIFFAVLSHWLLDFISHRPDMPLAPGLHTYFGLGLWSSVPAAVLLEGSFWFLAVIVFARSTNTRNRAALYWYWIVVALITLIWYNNLTGPPPPNPHLAPVLSLVLFSLIVAWAYWIGSKSDPSAVDER
jgi:hypothetical protein